MNPSAYAAAVSAKSARRELATRRPSELYATGECATREGAWRVAGLLRLETSFATRKLHIGYRRARLLAELFNRAVMGVGALYYWKNLREAPPAPP